MNQRQFTAVKVKTFKITTTGDLHLLGFKKAECLECHQVQDIDKMSFCKGTAIRKEGEEVIFSGHCVCNRCIDEGGD